MCNDGHSSKPILYRWWRRLDGLSKICDLGKVMVPNEVIGKGYLHNQSKMIKVEKSFKFTI